MLTYYGRSLDFAFQFFLIAHVHHNVVAGALAKKAKNLVGIQLVGFDVP